MSRIIGIDYGKKRCGIAATDPLQIIVNNLGAVETNQLNQYLNDYIKEEMVSKIVFGKPTHADGNPTFLFDEILKFVNSFQKAYPNIEIDFEDESFTSQKAKEIIFQSGIKKSKRRNKSLVDSVSAVLILQQYLGHI